jgi:hypothetical protein
MLDAERTYPTETVAKLLLLTPRRVRQLTAEGVLTRARDPESGEFLRGRYELFPTLNAYIQFLREGRLDDPVETAYTKARSRRMIAEAEQAELRLKVLKGKLHYAEDVEFVMTTMLPAVKARLLAIPSRTTRLLIGKTNFQEIFGLLYGEIELALKELSTYNPSDFAEQNAEYLASVDAAAVQYNGNGDDDADGRLYN